MRQVLMLDEVFNVGAGHAQSFLRRTEGEVGEPFPSVTASPPTVLGRHVAIDMCSDQLRL